ncbi:unnamed protein product [Trichobilharzia szidati]|nr:unnamed protein product [Trichobilharzia szidati]CAH8850930.1 unnamed protein product [Trichobilharzia szidati]
MVSQRSKLNLIILLSLYIVNIMKIESATYMLQMTVDGSEQMTVNFDGMNFTLSDDLTLTIQDNDCTRTVSLQPPTEDELITGSGYRSGSQLCKSWFARNRHNHQEMDEVKEYYEGSEP